MGAFQEIYELLLVQTVITKIKYMHYCLLLLEK